MKFYYEKVLGQERTFYEFRPRCSRTLPNVFSEQEVEWLFGVVNNLKHRTVGYKDRPSSKLLLQNFDFIFYFSL